MPALHCARTALYLYCTATVLLVSAHHGSTLQWPPALHSTYTALCMHYTVPTLQRALHCTVPTQQNAPTASLHCTAPPLLTPATALTVLPSLLCLHCSAYTARCLHRTKTVLLISAHHGPTLHGLGTAQYIHCTVPTLHCAYTTTCLHCSVPTPQNAPTAYLNCTAPPLHTPATAFYCHLSHLVPAKL